MMYTQAKAFINTLRSLEDYNLGSITWADFEQDIYDYMAQSQPIRVTKGQEPEDLADGRLKQCPECKRVWELNTHKAYRKLKNINKIYIINKLIFYAEITGYGKQPVKCPKCRGEVVNNIYNW